MISVIVPARNEQYLSRTIEDIYSKFTGDFEVVIILDGETEYSIPRDYPNLIILNNKEPNLRMAINKGVYASRGNYILKIDAHCIFGYGFDEILASDCDEGSVVVARRYTLDIDSWSRIPRIVDYYYLSCPWTNKTAFMMQSCPWITKTEQMYDLKIDDLMCFQGSMWFMSRSHWNWLGGLEIGEIKYAEHHEISMKSWLGGRRVIINKDTWYAHPRKSVRGYRMGYHSMLKDHILSAEYWIKNKWEMRLHDFDWLIDRFWPLPLEHTKHRTEKYYWIEDWRKHYDGTM